MAIIKMRCGERNVDIRFQLELEEYSVAAQDTADWRWEICTWSNNANKASDICRPDTCINVDMQLLKTHRISVIEE